MARVRLLGFYLWFGELLPDGEGEPPRGKQHSGHGSHEKHMKKKKKKKKNE
jgi:hypothetical protein